LFSITHPPTIIVVHQKERRSKCTVEPLRGHQGFELVKFPLKSPLRLQGYVRLGLGGKLLSAEDREAGLLVLDATWRLAAKMEAEFADIPVRSLPAWKTAYPRVSKLTADPEQGLATIEAIYLAYHLLGRTTAGLLDQYRWKEEFLTLNGVGKE
jgi:pre-rRNA-processing protein TSR3